MSAPEHEPEQEDEAPRSPIETRAADVVGVDFPQRIVELIVMPYGQTAVVRHEGRTIKEICERSAFQGLERRANRVRVNRDHDAARTVGRAVAFHPSREAGLVAELKIARTELGEETLALAEDGCLDASAGFAVMPGGEQWDELRTTRRLTRCWLAHIAMTPDPAFEGARVLSVRSASGEPERSATPHLDIVRSWQLDARYARLRR